MELSVVNFCVCGGFFKENFFLNILVIIWDLLLVWWLWYRWEIEVGRGLSDVFKVKCGFNGVVVRIYF